VANFLLCLLVQYSTVIPSLAGAGVDRRYTGVDGILVVCRLAPLRGPARLRCLRNMLLVIKQCLSSLQGPIHAMHNTPVCVFGPPMHHLGDTQGLPRHTMLK
jgi:hypothetical protein